MSALKTTASLASSFVYNITRSKISSIGSVIVMLWLLVALLAPWLAPYPPNEIISPFVLPFGTDALGNFFLLGTDHIGRDILSRIMWGSRTTLIYAPLATFIAYLIGISVGIASGYFRGLIDDLLSRLADLILSFPVMVLYVIIIANYGSSAFNIIVAIVFAVSPAIFRIVRGLTLSIREADYISAAQLRGESSFYIMFFEILPNIRGPIVVDVCLRMGYVTITIGILGFLGLGLPPPNPEWGAMISDARSMALLFPHMLIVPCIAITSFVLGLNMIADGLNKEN